MIQRIANYYNESLLEKKICWSFFKGKVSQLLGPPTCPVGDLLQCYFSSLQVKASVSFHFFIKALSRNIVD